MFAYLNHHNARLSQFSMTLTTYYSKLYQQEGGGGKKVEGVLTRDIIWELC